MRAACAEIRHHAPLRRTHNARRLRRDQRLMVDLCEDRRLEELRVNHRRHDRQDRLVRIDDRPLRHGVNVPAKPEIPQELQKIFRKKILRTEERNILIRKRKVLHELDHMLKSCKHRIAALIRHRSEEEIERDAAVAPSLLKISVRHRHLIKIHHHGQITLVELRHGRNLLYRGCKKRYE